MTGLFVVRDAEGKLDEIVRRIVEKFNPVRIILFGSRARKDAKPDSDADLLVVMPVRGSRRRTATEVDLALLGIDLPVDIIVVTHEDLENGQGIVGSIIHTALLNGRVLHERAA